MSLYVIRVEGALSAGLMSAFPSMHATSRAQTVLQGRLEDQSTLAAVVRRLESLGANIAEVHRVPSCDAIKVPTTPDGSDSRQE